MCVNFNMNDITGVQFFNLQSLNMASGRVKNCLFYDDKILIKEFNFNSAVLSDSFFVNISRNLRI